MEKLRAYLRRVMDEKGLSEWELEKRSKGKIKDSYIKDILSGKTKSISVEKLNALADGLDLDGQNHNKIASSSNPPAAQEGARPPGHFVKAVERMLHDTEFAGVVGALMRVKPSRHRAFRRQLETS